MLVNVFCYKFNTIKKPFYLIIRLYMGDFKRLMTN